MKFRNNETLYLYFSDLEQNCYLFNRYYSRKLNIALTRKCILCVWGIDALICPNKKSEKFVIECSFQWWSGVWVKVGIDSVTNLHEKEQICNLCSEVDGGSRPVSSHYFDFWIHQDYFFFKNENHVQIIAKFTFPMCTLSTLLNWLGLLLLFCLLIY